MKYPAVLTEAETIAAAARGYSLSRFGDGELRLATGGSAISQAYDPKLAVELRGILSDGKSLACIPNALTPNTSTWMPYFGAKVTGLLKKGKRYGSSFVTRPDNAPWIDTPDYWNSVRSIWRDYVVTLVAGDGKSLRPRDFPEATHVDVIDAPAKHAYAQIDEIEERIGIRAGPIILCLGATATVLAERLCKKGMWALDLGHMGMFMRAAGAYRFAIDDLASETYRDTLQKMHARGKWGGDGKKHADEVDRFSVQLNAGSILDYGCGRGTLAKAMAPRRVHEYDPGVAGKSRLPKPCDLVVCTDVMEHVEPGSIDDVLTHIHALAGKGAYFVIALRPAEAILPDGRNAHLVIQNAEFWLLKLEKAGWKAENMKIFTQKDREMKVWARK